MGDKLLLKLTAVEKQAGQSLVRAKLNELGERQMDLERGLEQVQQEMESLDREAVDAEAVHAALGKVKELFGALKPYQQKEPMQLVLKTAEVNEREIVLEIYALSEASLAGKVSAQGEVVRTRPNLAPRVVGKSELFSASRPWPGLDSTRSVPLRLRTTSLFNDR
jgi:hypothetical protein